MQSIQPTNCQNFKGIYTVRIPKTAFKNPENVKKCALQVDRALSGGGKLYAYIEVFRAMFGKKATGKVLTSMNGFLVDAENKEGWHTFNIITGKTREDYLNKLSLENVKRLIEEYRMAGRKPDSKEIHSEILRQAKWELAQKPNKEIEVNSLEKLKELAGELIKE